MTRVYSEQHEIRRRTESWPKIEGKPLDEADIGRWVTYTTPHGEKQRGSLSSYRPDGSIFVRFSGPGGERCDPRQLTWG